MNSFFASVEQHLDPNLRNRPVAISAIDPKSGSCVAASYEAKAYGVKTGTPVRDAIRMCPGIVILPSRHRLYVRYNLRIGAILDRMAELERIRSVDEFQLRLTGESTRLEGAFGLVTRMKAAVASEIGPAIRFSAGIGPNHLLAKIAGKLQKPDGFAWLNRTNMPDRVSHLKLDDLPGISSGILVRLHRAGIHDIPSLWALDPRHARMIWHSVEGERFVRGFQGEDIPLTIPGERSGYGNGKVLSPENRTPAAALLVVRWLIEKAGARLRRDGRVASRIGLTVTIPGPRYSDPTTSWGRGLKCQASQDTAYFHDLTGRLWTRMFEQCRPRSLLSVAIQLSEVSLLTERTGDLFGPDMQRQVAAVQSHAAAVQASGERSRGEKVSAVADMINRRFGPDTIRLGESRPHPGFFERG